MSRRPFLKGLCQGSGYSCVLTRIEAQMKVCVLCVRKREIKVNENNLLHDDFKLKFLPKRFIFQLSFCL